MSKALEQIATLKSHGFVVIRALADAARCAEIRRAARAQLLAKAAPLEYEADLHYPGAPASRRAGGGETVRRLLNAYDRDRVFRCWAAWPSIVDWMQMYFGEPVMLTKAHHNCIMTKHPVYGSLTGWHRDARYWSFKRNNLISAWLALESETVRNGALRFVPGSHRIALPSDCFDHAQFFHARPEHHPEMAALLQTAVLPALGAGDAVFFHCNTLHAAGANFSNKIKYSLAFAYHGSSNPPLPGSRSASMPEVALTPSNDAPCCAQDRRADHFPLPDR
ncbi:Phytanoyl-CoA dioxygenase [Candidatus Glomeribacter gigasporarum BEG34]|uniref:Phytanoyl-CoA dioxygenase n=1 Tax=Candidatus Glomeribacter gigasporarum BEG34 TaxID=1070319 RepID=G2JAE0_9BURK|nr:phytanoyl-CoA dioxygenase family protein [Candidatus Glomeribacter gigasporarum]CCD29741.1 Phytanoyl-CoA dioxygenase [Candidatus Glomeribacter gigasporarum BEG34]